MLLRISLVCDLLAAVGLITHLLAGRESLRRLGVWMLGTSFAAATLTLVLRGAAGLAAPSFHDQALLLAWMLIGSYLLLQARYQLSVLGAVVAPLSFLLALSSYLAYSGVDQLPGELGSAWLPAHVAPAMMAYAIFAVAASVSLLYLLQERQLKGRRGGGMLRRLPSLEALDELNFRFVAWGFALITLGIVTGAILAKATWGKFWTFEPVQVLATLAWMLYAVLLHARTVGWRGRRAAQLTIAGFLLLVISFVGLVFPGRHAATMG